MKRYQSILLGLTVLIIFALHIFLQSKSWKNPIENYINDHLSEKSGWTISIAELDGNLLSTVKGKGVSFKHKNGSQLFLNEVSFKINFIESLVSGASLSILKIENSEFLPVIEKDSTNTNTSIDLHIPTDLRFNIDQLFIDCLVQLPLMDQISEWKVSINSKLEFNENKNEIFINEFSISSTEPEYKIILKNTPVSMTEQSISFSQINGYMNSFPFQGDVYFDWSNIPVLAGNFHIENFEFPDTLLENFPLNAKLSSFEINLNFKSDLTNYQADASIKNALGLSMKGEISFTKHTDYYSLNQFELNSENSKLNLTAIYEDNGRINGSIILSGFDLSQWVKEKQKTNLNGNIILEGIIQNNRFNDLTVSMEINESKLYDGREIAISGTYYFNNNKLTFETPLSLSIGPSAVTAKGFIDFSNEQINLDLKLKNAGVFIINNFWKDSLNSGIATGDLFVNGTFDNPAIRAELDCKNIQYHNIFFQQIKMNAQWKPVEQQGEGFFRGQIGKGSWKNYSFDNGIIDIAFSRKGIDIQSAEFKFQKNYIQISGELSADSVLTLDRLQAAIDDHYFINSKPLTLKINPEWIEFYPFEMHVDDGIAKGQFIYKDKFRGNIHLSNVNVNIMKIFSDDQRFQISGLSFGSLSVRDIDNAVKVDMDMIVKDGIAAQQKFDQLILNGSLHKKQLRVANVTLIENGVKRIFVKGSVPLGKVEGQREFDFNIILNGLDLSLLTQFKPPSVNMDGVISGAIFFGGNPDVTKYDFEIEIQDAIYDQIPLGLVLGEGLYDGKILYLNEFSSNHRGSRISGSGYIPIDYNIGSEQFNEFFPDKPMSVHVRGELNNMEFLTTYISTVDSIIGDIEIELDIIGPNNNLIRNGFLKASKATIYLTDLDKPIYSVDCIAGLKSNKLTISDFNGAMTKNGKKTKVQNLTVNGSMDMTKFFDPFYNFKITGKEIYYRTLLGDIDGIVNVDLNFAGRDTIEIKGKVEAVNAVMFQEFTSDQIVDEEINKNTTVYNYKINFPITGDFELRNTQLDAFLSGELSMTKLGNNPYDFRGELYVREGNFYYYGDIFKINEGYMMLDEEGFNPYLDIKAQTKINQEQINVQLIGRLDNPQLVLESSSGFSESDIIELLTIRNRFEDQEISASGFGNSAQNILGAYLERQFEKNILQITGLQKAGIIDNVSISGTSGLIDPESSEEFSISAESRLSDNLLLNYSYHRSFSLSSPSTNKVGVELKLNRYLSLVGNVDETGNMHVKYRLRYSY